MKVVEQFVLGKHAERVFAKMRVVCAVVAEASRFYRWPDVVYIPIRDAPPIQSALVWRTANETPAVRSLAEAATDKASPTV